MRFGRRGTFDVVNLSVATADGSVALAGKVRGAPTWAGSRVVAHLDFSVPDVGSGVLPLGPLPMRVRQASAKGTLELQTTAGSVDRASGAVHIRASGSSAPDHALGLTSGFAVHDVSVGGAHLDFELDKNGKVTLLPTSRIEDVSLGVQGTVHHTER